MSWQLSFGRLQPRPLSVISTIGCCRNHRYKWRTERFLSLRRHFTRRQHRSLTYFYQPQMDSSQRYVGSVRKDSPVACERTLAARGRTFYCFIQSIRCITSAASCYGEVAVAMP